MRREDFVFCIGFEGSTAIIDGRLQRRYGANSTRLLAEAGLFKQALCSALFNGAPDELDEVLSLYNQRAGAPVRSVEELKRIFGTSGIPDGVKKITVV